MAGIKEEKVTVSGRVTAERHVPRIINGSPVKSIKTDNGHTVLLVPSMAYVAEHGGFIAVSGVKTKSGEIIAESIMCWR